MVELMSRYRNYDIKYYPDGMPLIDADVDITDDNFSILVRPRSLAAFMGIMFWCDAQRDAGRPVKHLVLPFVPGARQDKTSTTGDRLFTLRSIADIINARQFKTVTVLDPHSIVTPALIKRCRVVDARKAVLGPGGEYDGVIAPDAGAAVRAHGVARALNVGLVVQATKQRNVEDGTLSDYAIPALSPGRYLVVDDICDGGATFLALANAVMKTPGLVLSLFVTHGLFSKGTAELRTKFSKIITTDSILHEQPLAGVTTVNICHDLLHDATV